MMMADWLLPSSMPRWLLMWAIAAALFAGCKCLTWRDVRAQHAPRWKQCAFMLAWPGFDAGTFLSSPVTQRPTMSEWSMAATKTILGGAIFWIVPGMLPANQALLIGWVGMIGIVLMLHFGSFHMISCFWRMAGLEAAPLMQRPLCATSISAFWGRHWNTAFRDLTHRFLFRPLKAKLGPRPALLAGFLISGIIHEAVITLPAGGGYGLPTLFFFLQGLAMLFERSRVARRWGLGRGWRGWLFTMLMLLLPAGVLFAPPFIEAIMLPFMHALGAISWN